MESKTQSLHIMEALQLHHAAMQRSAERRTSSDDYIAEDQFCIGGIELPICSSSSSESDSVQAEGYQEMPSPVTTGVGSPLNGSSSATTDDLRDTYYERADVEWKQGGPSGHNGVDYAVTK